MFILSTKQNSCLYIYFFCYFCSDVVVFWILDMLLLSNAAAFVG